MLKLIKWDFIDYIERNSWILVGMLISLLLVLVPSSGVGMFNNLLITLSALIGFIVFQASIISAVIFAYRWLDEPSNQLELSLPVPAWMQIGAKLLFIALVNCVSCIFALQYLALVNRFSGSSNLMISLENLASIPGLVLFFLFIDATILFSYVVARSFPITRRMVFFITTIASLVILSTILIITIALMSAAGQVVLPTISSDNILTINGTLQIMSTAIVVWVNLIAIFIECLLSSLLLNNRFQVA